MAKTDPTVLPSTPQTRMVEQAIRDRQLLEAFDDMEGHDDGEGREYLVTCVAESERIYRAVMNPKNPERWRSVQPCPEPSEGSRNAAPRTR